MNDMKLAIMQPYFLPYIGYFQLINYADVFVIYDDVSFIKGGWINKNRFKINSINKQLSLPLIAASSNKVINEIRISSSSRLMNKMLKTFQENYRKCPHYSDINDLLSISIPFYEELLVNYLKRQIEWVCSYLEIKTKILLSSDLGIERELEASDRIIQICKKLNADTYVNPIGGRSLYNSEHFIDRKIKLEFLESIPVTLNRSLLSEEGRLSILELLMYKSKEEIKNDLSLFRIDG
jgi:hypothetical protein